jgi:hypothetical protein
MKEVSVMSASRSRTWTRLASREWIAPLQWLLLLTLLALAYGTSWGQTATKKAAADTADADGFNVRVVEEGKTTTVTSKDLKQAREEAQRARDEARRLAEETAHLRAKGVIPPEPPDVPETPDLPDINLDSSDNNVVRFGEDITIPEDKVIDGDVVAIGGSVKVLGRVKGDCVSIGGTVSIEGKGVVEGDAVSMGGGVNTADSGSVGGSNVSLGSWEMGGGRHFWPAVGFFGAMSVGVWLITTLIKLALTLFFAWLALLLMRERILHSVEAMTSHFGKAFLYGLLGFAGMVAAIPTGIILIVLVGVLAAVILAITIIGIPLAILVIIAMVFAIIGLVVAAFLAIFVGFLNGSMYLGRRVLGSRPIAAKPLMAILAGMALIAVLDIIGDLLGFVGVVLFHPVSIALGIAAGALAVIVTTAGLGGMVLTRFSPGPGRGFADGAQWWPPSKGAAPAAPAAAPPPPAPASPTAPPPPEGGSSDAP